MKCCARETATDAPVSCREVVSGGGHRVGFAMLNAERSLNALSLEMIRLLDARVRSWAEDPGIACVVLYGSGEKSFCAGGDIRSLYKARQEQDVPPPHPAAMAFFAEEYRLDHLLHHFPKPLLVWGSGLVLGGGLGLMVGASHRIVTETSRVAMPEVTIGLFPDVGGSWFLRRMPGRMGIFEALTGAQLNGHDALVAGLADYFVRSRERDHLFARLTQIPWTADDKNNRTPLTEALRDFTTPAEPYRPASNLLQHAATIDALCEGDSLSEVVHRIVGYTGDDAWLKRAAATLAAGSPTSAALAWELQHRAANASLADMLRLEMIVALHCCALPDFTEGVRALLIDKDNAPRWSPKTLADVSPEWIAEHFAPFAWPNGQHPLADL